ncbi:MAG: winged helix DNA-binding protein [Bacteroidetes bacterium]|nr:winged helix DNA-binding protein [Bacteroidota bacterium]
MKIEQEIKQSKFRNEYHKLAINLAYTANWLSRITAQTLKPYKLTPQQFNVLRILRGQQPNPASINLITERMIDKMSNASRLVDKLLEKALVERTVCPTDRRQVDVRITDKGIALLAELDPKLDELNTLLGRISVDEAAKLNELLDRIRD